MRRTRLRSTPTSLPCHFITLPATNTFSTLLVSISVKIVPGTLLSGKTLMRSVASMMMSASFPGGQGADLVVEMGCFGARDGGHFDDLTAGHEWGQVLLAGERAFVDEGALQGEGRAHDREHVSGHIALEIDAETRLDAVIERPLKRRHSMSHLHFDGRRDGNLAAGVGDHLPVGFTELR